MQPALSSTISCFHLLSRPYNHLRLHIATSQYMSQADLATKSDISLPHISEIELGKSSMRLSSFIRIVEALNVSSDYLLRANVQEVNNIYQTEFAEILADCTPTELDSILKIVKELKTTMHNKAEV